MAREAYIKYRKDGTDRTVELGTINSITDTINASVTVPKMAMLKAEEQFGMDMGSTEDINISLNHFNGYTKTNSVWMREMIEAVNRWQAESDGCRFTYIPDGDIANFVAYYNAVNAYISSITFKWNAQAPEVIGATLNLKVGTIMGGSQTSELLSNASVQMIPMTRDGSEGTAITMMGYDEGRYFNVINNMRITGGMDASFDSIELECPRRMLEDVASTDSIIPGRTRIRLNGAMGWGDYVVTNTDTQDTVCTITAYTVASILQSASLDEAIYCAVYESSSYSVSFTPSPSNAGYFLRNGTSRVTYITAPAGCQYSVSRDSIVFYLSNGLTIDIKATPNEGYQFKSWSVSSGTVSSNMEIIATFETKQYEYTLRYNTNGSSTYIDPTKKNSDNADYCDITISSEVPIRSDYDFLGWATSSSATSASYQPGGTYRVVTSGDTREATIYAVWRYNPSTLKKMYFGVGINGEGSTPSRGYVRAENLTRGTQATTTTENYIEFEVGDSIRLTGVPNSGYAFGRWLYKGNPQIQVETNPLTFTATAYDAEPSNTNGEPKYATFGTASKGGSTEESKGDVQTRSLSKSAEPTRASVATGTVIPDTGGGIIPAPVDTVTPWEVITRILGTGINVGATIYTWKTTNQSHHGRLYVNTDNTSRQWMSNSSSMVSAIAPIFPKGMNKWYILQLCAYYLGCRIYFADGDCYITRFDHYDAYPDRRNIRLDEPSSWSSGTNIGLSDRLVGTPQIGSSASSYICNQIAFKYWDLEAKENRTYLDVSMIDGTTRTTDHPGEAYSQTVNGIQSQTRTLSGICDALDAEEICHGMITWNIYGSQGITFRVNELSSNGWEPTFKSINDNIGTEFYAFSIKDEINSYSTNLYSYPAGSPTTTGNYHPCQIILTQYTRHFPIGQTDYTFGTLNPVSLSSSFSKNDNKLEALNSPSSVPNGLNVRISIILNSYRTVDMMIIWSRSQR